MNPNDYKPNLRPHPVLDHPLLAGVILPLYGLVLYEIAGIPAGDDNETGAAILGALCALVLLAIHRFWFRPELKTCFSLSFLRDRKLLLLSSLFLLAVFATWLPGVLRLGFAAPTLLTLAEALTVGFTEEAVFRVLPLSVMMRTYKDRGSFLPALLLPAILFGLVHFINLYGGGDVNATILQVISASVGGIFFAAVYLRSGSLIPSFLLHFLFDFIVFMQGPPAASGFVTASEIMEEGLLDIAEIVIVIFLLKGQKQAIIDTWNKLWSGGQR